MAVRQADVVLVGGGVMSATLGMMLRQLDPSLDIVMVERLDHVAHESTDGWNNAGTGHAGYCELNYTPETDDGDVTIDRALQINAQFEVSLQLWSYLVEQGILPEPSTFINRTPHQSFVWVKRTWPSSSAATSALVPITCSATWNTPSPEGSRRMDAPDRQ